jgi:hypothetical protein
MRNGKRNPLKNYGAAHYTITEGEKIRAKQIRFIEKNTKMTESLMPTSTNKPPVRCSECDREMEHYNVFLAPTNEEKIVCWECLGREEKGFFAKRGFRRGARDGFIPR